MSLVGKHGLRKEYHKTDLEKVIGELEGTIVKLREGTLDDVSKIRTSEEKVQNIKDKCSKEMVKLEDENQKIQEECKIRMDRVNDEHEQTRTEFFSKREETEKQKKQLAGLVVKWNKLNRKNKSLEEKVKKQQNATDKGLIAEAEQQGLRHAIQTKDKHIETKDKQINNLTGTIGRLSEELENVKEKCEKEKEAAIKDCEKAKEECKNVNEQLMAKISPKSNGGRKRKTRRKRKRTKRKSHFRKRRTKRKRGGKSPKTKRRRRSRN